MEGAAGRRGAPDIGQATCGGVLSGEGAKNKVGALVHGRDQWQDDHDGQIGNQQEHCADVCVELHALRAYRTEAASRHQTHCTHNRRPVLFPPFRRPDNKSWDKLDGQKPREL